MSSSQIFCQNCGTANKASANFCSACGAELAKPVAAPPQPAPQVPAAPPPSSRPAAARSWKPWIIAGVIVVFLMCVAIGLVGYFYGDQIYAHLLAWWNSGIAPTEVATIEPPSSEPTADPGTVVTGEGSVAATSALAAQVSSPSGASIKVPAGAVPLMEDGSAGTMVFSIEANASITVSLSGGFEGVGSVYSLGPEGFIFTVPVEITLPIPAGIDPALIFGMTYFDTATSTWKLVPANVDESAMTATTSTNQFSNWSLFGRCLSSITGDCDGRDRWNAAHGGWLKVVNTHGYSTGTYPGGRGYSTSTGYGVCIQSYAFDDSDDAWNWLEPTDWKVVAYDGQTTSYWLPSGRFNLIEVYHVSEVNSDPLYVPAHTTYWRALGDYIIAPGETLQFTSSGITIDDTWTEGRPPCWGARDTAVGTGDVQITLTWQTNDDIDLHVFDPDGYHIYFADPISTSGGQLDRDNMCADMIIGRPENIFWPEGTAPSGTYRVQVHYWTPCEMEKPVTWTVRTVIAGEVQTYTGTLTYEDETQDVVTFTIP